MKTQIPIYRAKKIDSNKYVEGFLQQDACGFYVISYYMPPVGYGSTKIDLTTLAIHFPDTLDSEDTPIFASLSEDGRGGDRGIHPTNNNKDLNGTVTYYKSRFAIADGFSPKWNRLKVTGIQE